MINFYFNFTRNTVILLLLTIFLIALAFVLPIEYSYENHLLENLEVVILFIGFIFNIKMIFKTELYDSIKFYVASSVVYLLMIGRELSWGRVFYPVGLDNHGEQIFVKVQELWYGPVVYPIVGFLIILALLLLGYFAYQCKTKGIRINVPLEAFGLFVIMGILSQCVFDRGLISTLGDYNQLLEENCEILAYISLLICSYKISFKKIYIRIKYFSMI